jgi:hypothetical protein
MTSKAAGARVEHGIPILLTQIVHALVEALLNTMILVFGIVREGKIWLGGSTGSMLARVCPGCAPWWIVRLN